MSDQALKKDAGKDPMELLPLRALREVSKVYGHGAQKYAPNAWRKGMAYSRLIGSCLRHLTEFARGKTLDDQPDPSGAPGSGCHHLSGAIFSLLCLLEYELTGTGEDDRYKYPTDP